MHPSVRSQYRQNASHLRAVISAWERYGQCDGFSHMLACGIVHQNMKPRKRIPMFGPDSDVQFLLLAMGITAAWLDSESNTVCRSEANDA